MQIRTTQASVFAQVRNGMSLSFSKLIRAQEQIATGKRLLRPSDDPIGTAMSLSIRRQRSEAERLLGSIGASRPLVETGASALEQAGGLLADARALVIQGLNGTLGANDRATIASEIDALRARLIEIANTRAGTTYVFAGTSSGSPAYAEQPASGSVRYLGNDEIQRVPVGFGSDMALNLAGSDVFGGGDPLGPAITGPTGAALGTSANQGAGFARLEVRHDATSGTLGAGLALVAGGASDTFLSDRALVVDAAAGTVQLGSGPARTLPQPGDPDLADFTVLDEHGAELHLDFTAYTGASSTDTVTGSGSISLDGTTFVPLDFLATDLELVDPASGAVLHVDTTGIRRSGTDLVTFTGAVDVFAVLQGIAADLRNVDGIGVDELTDRLGARLAELDRRHEGVLGALGEIGARLERLDDSESRLHDVDLHLAGLQSDVEDADLASVALDLARAEQTLQLAQATGARLIQNTLLSYLR